MKSSKTIFLVSLLTLSRFCFSQSNIEITSKSVDIVRWINNFEDHNSPERIMKGTLQDKVHAEYNRGSLIIYSMIWRGSHEPILVMRETLKIKDIIRIDAEESVNENNVIVDIAIYVQQGSIYLECKNENENQFYRCSFENSWFDKVGFCSKNLRFKFPKESASSQIKRVYNALTELAILNGGNPKVGSLF